LIPADFQLQFCSAKCRISTTRKLISTVLPSSRSVSRSHAHCTQFGIFTPCSPSILSDGQHSKAPNFSNSTEEINSSVSRNFLQPMNTFIAHKSLSSGSMKNTQPTGSTQSSAPAQNLWKSPLFPTSNSSP
jgi:hypothetical protein